MNKIIIKGNIVREVELKTIGETVLLQNAVAVQRKFKKEGQQDCDFINIKIWGKTAEFVNKYFNKGSQILISGRLETGSYEKDDGKKVFTTDVVVEEVEFCGKNETNTETNTGNNVEMFENSSDDLPF